MISPLGLSTFTNPLVVAPSSLDEGPAGGPLPPVAADGTSDGDTLQLSSPSALAIRDAFGQRFALKLRSHAELRQSDDGELQYKAQSQLKFRYDFQAADGTTIRLRAKAKLEYKAEVGDDGLTQSLKYKTKLKIQLVQEDVSDGLSPLLDSPEIAPEAQDAIAQAIDLFQQLTSIATDAFLGSDPLDGDALIAGVVDAFNQLSAAVQAPFLPPPEPVGDSTAATQPVPLPVPAPEPLPVDAVVEPPAPLPAPVPDNPEPLPTAPALLDSPPAAQQLADSPSAADVGVDEKVAEDATVDDSPLAQSPTVPTQDTANSPSETAVPEAVDSALNVIRLRLVQSLTSVVRLFESDSSQLLATQVTYRASARLTAETSTPYLASALDSGQAIDSQV